MSIMQCSSLCCLGRVVEGVGDLWGFMGDFLWWFPFMEELAECSDLPRFTD